MTDLSSKKFGLITLGCDKNRVDAEKLLARIKRHGCRITNDINETDVLIINTCAFLEDSRREAIDTIIEYSAFKSAGLEKIVVTGCLSNKFIDELYNELTEADVFLGVYDYDMFFTALDKAYECGRSNFVGKGRNTFCCERTLTTPVHYAYLKIADGCDNCCTYCLIPKIRGRYFSYPIESLVSEAEGLGEISELILVAQDVTRYGIDLYGRKKICEILQNLTKLVNINSVRLLYCYPEMIDDDLISEVRDNPKIIKYFDIPFQHSEDRILSLMNRRGTRRSYLELIQKLRREIPGVAIRSTFICGFPTETKEESDALASFLEDARLDNCGFFMYSREEGTAAYGIEGQIPESTKRRRAKMMYDVQRRISRDKLSSYKGKKLRVLCDGIDAKKRCFYGRPYFFAPDIDGRVYFNASYAEQGKYYDVVITKSSSYDLFGHTEDYSDE